MQIRVVAFGITKDILGQREIMIDLPGAENVQSVLDHLSETYPALSDLASLRVAVNESYVSPDHPLAHKDEVVLIPPVSGG